MNATTHKNPGGKSDAVPENTWAPRWSQGSGVSYDLRDRMPGRSPRGFRTEPGLPPATQIRAHRP